MSRERVVVVDGPVPSHAWERPNREPSFHMTAELDAMAQELRQREPIFHRSGFGVSRQDFEAMTAPTFWEVGASGRRYSREFVLDLLEERYQSATEAVWEVEDFCCQGIGADSCRATIWTKRTGGWQIVYHQGTVVT